jgi:acetyl esterase/lipase
VQVPPEQELPPILPEEKVVLDIWHWNEGELQTQQQKRTRRDGTLTAVWHRAERRLQVVGSGHVEQVRLITPDGSRGVGSDDDRYEKLTQWDGRYADVYLVNTVDGSRQKVLEKLRGNVSNSPGGRWLCWFGPDYHWWALDVATQQKRDLTGMLPVAFHNVEDDHPEPDPAYGIAGWTANDASVLLYDEYDVWQVAPATGEAVCVTDGFGRSNHLRLRVQRLPRDDDEDDLALPDDLLLAATDTETMAEGFYTDVLGRTQKPQRLVQMDKRLGELRKAKKAERFYLTIGSFAEFPDLWTSDARFGGLRKLSAANPQQKEFRWGNAELVHWVNGDGVQLKGILVKPDGFDPHRKYPMLVNFYERSAQNLHNYVAPAPGTGPNASYYVSNGYLWFMPDIVYEVGYPGESCVKCVVSGVESLIAQGFVDEHAIGAAGHSWGGYQTAFLVTRTNIFAAVESGAPVSDMISAYGGIRYESGVSRQFQYEQTQSRIGGTPWTHPMRYWENSPIFFADKVRTPVLILHNDNDGAVPWTNGIEYFTALKRLGKEAYLFDYNGEPHGLTKRQNMKDWARRMAEFFDHHLKHAPMPKWMQDGVPFSERDREKLPFTRSYIEAQAEPASAKPVEATAPRPNPAIGDASKGEPKGDTVNQEPKPAAQGQEPKPAPKPEEKPQGEAKKPDEKKPDEKKSEPKKAGDGKAAGVAPVVITPGRPAPDFAAADETGKVHKLADYRGKTLVLWFYAKADTPG